MKFYPIFLLVEDSGFEAQGARLLPMHPMLSMVRGPRGIKATPSLVDKMSELIV